MRNHPDQTDGASGPALSNAPQTGLPFSTPTAAQQPELAEADVADVQPMQIDPPGSGCNLAVAPCSTAAPAHHAAVAFVQPAARRSPRLRRSDCDGIISHADVHDPPGSSCTPAASPPVARPDAPADHAAAASVSSAAACPVLDHLRQLRPSEVLGIWEHGYNQITEMWEPELAAAYAAERVASRRAAEAKGRKRKRPAGA